MRFLQSTASVVLVLFLLGVICTAQPQPPSQLQVEYLPSPVLGLDVAQPRFQWVLAHSERGQVQKSYQILVSTSLNAAIGDMWDSGVVNGNASSQVVYQGKPLVSDSTYYWKVKWVDSQNKSSDFSNIARFDTGLFAPSDWTATWIGGNNQIRTEFSLAAGVSRARLFVVGLGYSITAINGRRVGDAVLGTFTTFEKRILYDTYDVTNHLRQGSNAVAVSLGHGWYSQPSVNVGPMSLLFQLQITLTTGAKVVIRSNTNDWKTHAGPVTADDIYIGEDYDARLETPGWDMPGFNDAGWTVATPVPRPTGVLSSQLIPKITRADYYTAIAISNPAPGVYVFDMGQNMAGWSITRVQGPRGTKVTLQHSEMLWPNGTIHSIYSNSPMIDNYILKGQGMEVFEPKFTYHGFRYVQVTGWPGVPNLDSVTAVFLHTDLPEVGEIVFSSDLLNAIQHMTRFSSLSNFYNIPTDCPQRERRGWLGDAQLSAETTIHNWYMPAAYTKFIQDIRDSQVLLNNKGTVGDCVPFYGHGGAPADPAWGSAYTLLWHWMYEYYGDKRILSQFYDGVKSYVDSLVSETASNGFLMWSRYGDWCSVAKGLTSGCDYPSSIASSFYYLLQLEQFAEAAQIVGNQADQQKYSTLAQNVRKNWDAVFYNTNTKTYGDGYQTDLTLCLWLGVVPQARYQATVDQLFQAIEKKTNHLDTGIVGTKYLFPLLSRLNRTDIAETIATQTTAPSWGWMRENGATTLWENWPGDRYNTYGSRNHIMFGTQGPWFFKDIGGIGQVTNINTVAFQHILIYPRVSELKLTSASSSLKTVKGLVQSSWYKTGTTAYTHQVVVPVNSIADIVISKTGATAVVQEGKTTVWSSGKFVPGTPGVYSGVDDGKTIKFRVGSGSYEFKVSV